MSTTMVIATTIMRPILAAVCVLIHCPHGFFGQVSVCGEREGRNILCVERHINDNRHGASYD